MRKKGELEMDTIGKLIIALVVLILLITFIFLFKEKLGNLFDKFFEVLRFRR